MLEIMAPVGCFESLAAAIQAGAGSVYFGIQGLNMRSGSANNFTIEDLKHIADTCRENGMKSYLTVNTILYDGDLEKMRQIIDAAEAAGVSAIIASDVAAMAYARGFDRPDKKPRIEVHLSTQLNISNVEALKFYAQFADVAVLARELNMDQVSAIHEEIVKQQIKGPGGKLVRIEMFCHGALCMAVSGKCYMSLHEYNRSANRGACAQVCRHAYEAFLLNDLDHDIQIEVDNKYLMSPKDLKTIHFINKMIDAGVEVFKIEGRARGPEYVKTVVGCYKEAINSLQLYDNENKQSLHDNENKQSLHDNEGKQSLYDDEDKQSLHDNENKQSLHDNHKCLVPSNWEDLVAGWDERLSKVFNRGFWNGYYMGQRLGEWSHNYGSVAKEHKEYAAKTIGWYSRIGIGDFQCEAMELHKGDELLIIGPTTGVIEIKLDEIQVDYKTVETVHKGERFTIPVSQKIRPSDKVFKVVKN